MSQCLETPQTLATYLVPRPLNLVYAIALHVSFEDEQGNAAAVTAVSAVSAADKVKQKKGTEKEMEKARRALVKSLRCSRTASATRAAGGKEEAILCIQEEAWIARLVADYRLCAVITSRSEHRAETFCRQEEEHLLTSR